MKESATVEEQSFKVCSSRLRHKGKLKLKKLQQKTASLEEMEKEVNKTENSSVTCSKEKIKTDESKRKEKTEQCRDIVKNKMARRK
jgi:hypothetical protein